MMEHKYPLPNIISTVTKYSRNDLGLTISKQNKNLDAETVVQTLKAGKEFQKFNRVFKKVSESDGNIMLAFYVTFIQEQVDIR
jgi:hypothetical protein